MNWNQIIAITVLGMLTLMLGCKPKPNSVEPKPNPVKPKTISQKGVVGTYEYKSDDAHRLVFLDNGTVEFYEDGEKYLKDVKWSIENNEIHIEFSQGAPIYRINPDNSITNIASIIDGKRTDYPKEQRTLTYKKIK